MKEHPTHSGYFVTEAGEIFSGLSGALRSLKPLDNGLGYLRVRVKDNGKKKHKYIHRLVAETFLSNPHSYTEVNHRNGDKSDNRVENLEWCSRSQNLKHAYALGLHQGPRKVSKKTSTGRKNLAQNNFSETNTESG